MLAAADVEALVQGRHADPFAVLGMHADASGALWMRAMLPGALSVALHTAAGQAGCVVKLAQRGATGLWEAQVPRRKNRFDYRLQVGWADGSAGRYADAYAFG